MSQAVPRLHAPTDDRVLALPDFLKRARALMDQGVGVHLRSGTRSAREMLAMAQALPGCWINDRVDIARVAGARGVHLPAAGLDIAAVRALVPHAVVGRSCHSVHEARTALNAGADYAFLGPIWPTASHPDRPALGVNSIEEAAPVGRVIAIGGITLERVAECRAKGAWGVAGISALWDSPDPGATAREMLLLLKE